MIEIIPSRAPSRPDRGRISRADAQRTPRRASRAWLPRKRAQPKSSRSPKWSGKRSPTQRDDVAGDGVVCSNFMAQGGAFPGRPLARSLGAARGYPRRGSTGRLRVFRRRASAARFWRRMSGRNIPSSVLSDRVGEVAELGVGWRVEAGVSGRMVDGAWASGPLPLRDGSGTTAPLASPSVHAHVRTVRGVRRRRATSPVKLPVVVGIVQRHVIDLPALVALALRRNGAWRRR